MKIALIGAGAAGAACVSVLRSRRADFCIFEKSRGVGGRLCTRRVSDALPSHTLLYDHGCPSFKVGETLNSFITSDLSLNSLRQISSELWVSAPTMPHFIKELLGASQLHTQCEIDAIEGKPGAWFLTEKSRGNAEAPRRFGPFEKIVITAPAPQALNLLRNTEHSWAAPLNSVKYSPCWVLLISVQSDSPVGFSASSIFSSISNQESKPERTTQPSISSWVAHASPHWSKQHLELESADVQNILIDEFKKIVPSHAVQIVHSAVHRWRFAQVTQPMNTVALYDEQKSLFYAADACLGNGVEGALLSGRTVGQHITQHIV